MSAGHAYRVDGWCSHPRCLRCIEDAPDLGACPDTEGNDLAFRSDVPYDKREAMRMHQNDRIAHIIGVLAEKFRWPKRASR